MPPCAREFDLTSDLRLVLPDACYKTSYIEALREGMNPDDPDDIHRIENDFDAWLKDENDLTIPVTLPDGRQALRVPFTEYWLIKNDTFLGRISVRHHLNEWLERVGGHIGYSIRKSARKQGYGRKILAMALPLAHGLEIDKALLTCHDDNIGSIKIIESCGGILQDKITIPGKTVLHRRYWINLSASSL